MDLIILLSIQILGLSVIKLKNKQCISWDFDYTLYDPNRKKLIGNTFKLFTNMLKCNADVCITTYRTQEEAKEIEKIIPEIQIIATSGESKVTWFRMLDGKVKKHLDDDLMLCLQLLNLPHLKIEPVWIRHHWSKEYYKNVNLPENLKIIDVTEVKEPPYLILPVYN